MDEPSARSHGRAPVPPDEAPVARFHPTSGLLVSLASIVVVAVVVVYVLLSQHTVVGLRIAAGALLVGLLVWTVGLRPRVTAYRRVAVLHGSFSDLVVPYALVDRVELGHTLRLHVGPRRLVCVGIGRSRSPRPAPRPRGAGLFGEGRLKQMASAAEPRAPRPEYADVVASRLTELVDAEHRARPSSAGAGPDDAPDRPQVQRRVAVPEVVALVVLVVVFALTFVL